MNGDQEEGEDDRRRKKGGQSDTRSRKAESYEETGGKTKEGVRGTWSRALYGRKVMKGGRRGQVGNLKNTQTQ